MIHQDFIRAYKNEKALIASELQRKRNQVKKLEGKYVQMELAIAQLEGKPSVKLDETEGK